MTGSSLWLVPPEDSELYQAVHDLILNKIPAIFPFSHPLRFTPHVTLTADTVLSDLGDSQQWLHGVELPLSGEDVKVAIGEIEVGSMFFRKLFMQCEKTRGLCELAMRAREAVIGESEMQSAKEWVKEEYRPHMSLM